MDDKKKDNKNSPPNDSSYLKNLQEQYIKESEEATKIINFYNKQKDINIKKGNNGKSVKNENKFLEDDDFNIYSKSKNFYEEEQRDENGRKSSETENRKSSGDNNNNPGGEGEEEGKGMKKRKKGKKKKLPLRTRLAHFFIPMKGDKPSVVIQKIICIAMTLVCIVSAGYIGNYLYANFRSSLTFKGLQDLFNTDPTQDEIDNLPTGYLPGVAKLYALNNDYKGWINIEGTTVNYPILQYTDNSFYLKHDFYKKSDQYGNPFVDFRCTIEAGKPLSTNTVLYGHRVKLGIHFSPIVNYIDLEYYKEHPIIEFNTPFEEAKWKVIAAYEAMDYPDPGSKFDYNNYINKSSDEEFLWYVEEARKRSFLYMDVDIQPDDKLLTLSTCYNEFVKDRGRFVVLARKVRPGESEEVNTDGAYKKKSSHILRYELFYNAYKDYPRYNPVGDPRDGTYTPASSKTNAGTSSVTAPSAAPVVPSSQINQTSSVPASSVPASSKLAPSMPASSIPASSIPASSVPESSEVIPSLPALSEPALSDPAMSQLPSSAPQQVSLPNETASLPSEQQSSSHGYLNSD